MSNDAAYDPNWGGLADGTNLDDDGLPPPTTFGMDFEETPAPPPVVQASSVPQVVQATSVATVTSSAVTPNANTGSSGDDGHRDPTLDRETSEIHALLDDETDKFPITVMHVYTQKGYGIGAKIVLGLSWLHFLLEGIMGFGFFEEGDFFLQDMFGWLYFPILLACGSHLFGLYLIKKLFIKINRPSTYKVADWYFAPPGLLNVVGVAVFVWGFLSGPFLGDPFPEAFKYVIGATGIVISALFGYLFQLYQRWSRSPEAKNLPTKYKPFISYIY